MNTSNYTAVIADDFTGAADTALQFFLSGAQAQIAFGANMSIDEELKTEVYALSSETRNVNASQAEEKTLNICENLLKKYNFEYVYKKMDSLLRGNFAVEIITMVKALEYDAAVIFPAFPAEGRTTAGGFQFINGVPIQRTDIFRTLKFPVTESNIVNLIKNQLPENKDTAALIPLDIVMKGAGAILLKLNELIEEGRKLIAADAVSDFDLEQTALAVSKCPYKILPAGSAGAAQSLSRLWHPPVNEEAEKQDIIPNIPKLIISGSASEINTRQINTLKACPDFHKIKFIPLKPENIFSNDTEETAQKILNGFEKSGAAVVYTSELIENNEEFNKLLLEKEMTKETFISKITPYLASAAQKALSRKDAVLIAAGGETASACFKEAGIKNVKITASPAPSVPAAKTSGGKYIVTKSGSFGTPDIFIKILKYIERAEK